MTRRPARVTQAEIARAVRGAKLAGLAVARVEIDEEAGKIVIVSENATQNIETPLEAWKARRNARQT
jgi:hypothetical protein